MLDTLKSGYFLNHERIRVYSWICIALMVAVIAGILLTANGNFAWDGKPIGTDFSNVYAAGLMANEGRAAEVWDWPKHFAVQDRVFGPQLEHYFGWHYPPFFLLVASALAVFPYLGALFVSQIIGFALYFTMLKNMVSEYEGWLLPVIGFPAIFVNITHGHNGFLTAALFGWAFLVIEKRPWLAGIMIGLLAYKPQFGILIPIALLIGGYYRTFTGASVTVLVLGASVTAVYGFEIWPAFFQSLELTRGIILEQGATGWFKIQSVFSFVMLWTESLSLAYALQGLLALAVLVVVCIAFRFPNAIEDRASLIIIGSLLVTPYSLDYDLVGLAPAIAFLAIRGLRDGFNTYEVFALLMLWFVPLLTRTVMMTTGIPLALIAMLAVFGIVTIRVIDNLKTANTKTAQYT